VKGSPEFRRNAWLEAKLVGIDVHGYKPSDSDHALLEAARREQARQRDALTIRKGEPPAPSSTKPAPGDATSVPATATTISRNPEAATTAPRGEMTPEEKTVGTSAGVLLEHGAARYQHQPDASYSYFVRYRDDSGAEQTAWGVDLKRAMSESGARVGDTVSLQNKGKTPVAVEQEVRDDSGKVIGTEWKDAIRNEWNVTVVPPTDPERGPTPAPQSVGQLREQFEKSLAGYPARTREEMLNRFDASVKVALEVERKVASGELKAADAGGAIDANFADLRKQWTAPAPRQAPAPAPVMQQTPKVGI